MTFGNINYSIAHPSNCIVFHTYLYLYSTIVSNPTSVLSMVSSFYDNKDDHLILLHSQRVRYFIYWCYAFLLKDDAHEICDLTK